MKGSLSATRASVLRAARPLAGPSLPRVPADLCVCPLVCVCVVSLSVSRLCVYAVSSCVDCRVCVCSCVF